MRTLVAAVVLLLLADAAIAGVYLKRERQSERAKKLAALRNHKQQAEEKPVEEKPVEEKKTAVRKLPNGYNYGFDVVGSVSQSTFSCLKNSYGNSLAFVRIYSGSNGGQTDSTGVSNAINAYNAGLSFEVFLQPSPGSSKTGGQQFNEAYSYATSQGLNLFRVWLLVHSPVDWGNYQYSNVNFIQSVINAASNSNVAIGIYTNWYDWDQITGSSTSISSNTQLWYWNANGWGQTRESSNDFYDFYQFGNFRSASAKQYGLGETQCATYLNVDVYSTNGMEMVEKNAVHPDALKKVQKKQ